MTGTELNQIYGAMITPSAPVTVPEAWMPAVHTAMQELVDLPTEIRAFFIVVGITVEDGHLTFSTAGAVAFLGSDGLKKVRDIIERAQVAVMELKGSVH